VTHTSNRPEISRYDATQGVRRPQPLSADDRTENPTPPRVDLARLRIERDTKAAVRPAPRAYRRGFFYLAVILGIVLGGYQAYSWIFGAASPVAVGTVRMAYPSEGYTLLNATGYVVPRIKADVASKATGRLQSLEAEEGTHVTKGQIIARLDNQDVIASMEQAAANVGVAHATLKEVEAELIDAKRSLDRGKKLIEKKFISERDFDGEVARFDKASASVTSAKANIVAADAAYKGAEVAVEYTLIRAPFDGVILTKQANVGDIVAPFSSAVASKGAVVTMADMDTLEVEVDVSESSFSRVAIGQACEIELDAIPDEHFRCVVDRIVPTVDRSKATVLVRVRFLDKSGRVLPNMSAKVAFLSRALPPGLQKPVTAVQKSAIVTRQGKQVVFQVQGDTVSEIPVTTGYRIGESVMIRQGLKAGDTVVLDPPGRLQDGSTIRAPQT
jgi:RND family efflux transporter MFP subunit